MKTSASGRKLIEAFEGLRLKAYQDESGKKIWTIGYGHTSAAGAPHVTPGMTITETQADQILSDDLHAVERNVERLIRVPLAQYEFDALVSFDFNTGDLAKSSIDDKINAGNKPAATATLLQYDHSAVGKVLSGLTRRRHAEKLLFEGKVLPALDLAGYHGSLNQPTPKAQKAPEKPVTEPQGSPVVRSNKTPATPGPQTGQNQAKAPSSGWISALLAALVAVLSAFSKTKD